jgi:hypothetical protein
MIRKLAGKIAITDESIRTVRAIVREYANASRLSDDRIRHELEKMVRFCMPNQENP